MTDRSLLNGDGSDAQSRAQDFLRRLAGPAKEAEQRRTSTTPDVHRDEKPVRVRSHQRRLPGRGR